MALNPCVKQILCALGNATLSSLNGLIQAQLLILDAKIIELDAELAVLDVLTFPLTALGAAAAEAVNAATASLSLVPLNLIAGCADLGDLNVNLTQILDNANADLQDYIVDINRKLSLKEELVALKDLLASIRQQFLDIQLTIAECSTP